MKIWVDVVTPAQVLFLHPIISELRRRDYRLILTTRHCTETVALANRYQLPHTTIGMHGGGSFVGKSFAIILRAVALTMLLKHQPVVLAISHSSYSQALVAAALRLPFVAMTDYEGHPGMRIVCHVAKRILVPYVFSKEKLYELGATARQVETYNGLKEDISLAGFQPDPLFLQSLGVSPDKILVTMRPASEVAAYHQFENPFFEETLQYIAQAPETFIVVLPRTVEQRQRYEALQLSNVMFPDQVLDGPNLIYHSDLVVGAGGTMNREARALGTPAYTLFRGILGSVDKYLIETGTMVHVMDTPDLPKIKLCKKPPVPYTSHKNDHLLVGEVVDRILAPLY